MLQYNNATPNSAPSKAAASAQNQSLPSDILRTLNGVATEDKERLIMIFEKSSELYEVYGESVELISSLISRTQVLQTNEGIPKCVYNASQFRSCLRDLVGSQGWRRIEIWDFSTVRKAWKCSKTASPGSMDSLDCYFENIDGSSGDLSLATSPLVVSLCINGSGSVGVAFADAVNFYFGLTEFSDNDLLANVEVALIQLGAVECIVSSSSPSLDKIKEITKNCGIALTLCKASEFTDDSQADLAKLIADEQFCAMEHPLLGLKAAAGLVSYLNLLGSDSNLRAFKLVPYNLDSYLKLDDTALRSLHVFSTSGTKGGSLYSLLNQCKTGQGARLLDQWLRQPLRSKEEIEARLDVVQTFVECSGLRQNLRETGLRAVPDLARILKRLVKNSANLQDIVVLYQVIAKIPALLQELEGAQNEAKYQAIQDRYIAPFSSLQENFVKFTEMVESMLDFAALERHEYIVRADFDESLQEIGGQKEEILTQIEPEFYRVARKLGLEANKKVKLERNSIYGYFFRVSRLDASLLKDDEEYQQLATQKNGVYFVTPLLRDLSLRYDELCKLYASKQSVLVKEMLVTASTYRPVFDQLNLIIADLDVCLSLAYVSVMSPKSFVRPTVGSSNLVLKSARHPCIENQVDFIANDVEFCRDAGFVQLITGPNMGGKSTYIRQAALIVVLAQIGCFVPCDSASVPIFDAVMVRVGAGDSILRGVSTFMAEMLETASILKTATKDSFVIIDELGRGTSTSEGLGLAWGVTKYIAQKIGCFTFFATHFHELTVLATELPSLVKNLHVSAQVFDGQLTMLYSVLPGVCDQSFGIHVAELANFPSVVVQMARLRNAELEGTPLIKFNSTEEENCAAQIVHETVQKIKQLSPNERKHCIADMLKSDSLPAPLKNLF